MENIIKGILINSETRKITEVAFKNELAEYYRLLNCDTIDRVTVNGHDIVIDDEANLKNPKHFFAYKDSGLLAGNGLIVDANEDGDWTSTTATLAEVVAGTFFANANDDPNDYDAFYDRQRAESDNFPLGAAFSLEQFEDMKKKLNVTDKSELIHIGYGAFIRKTDKDAFTELMRRHDWELDRFLEKKERFISAVRSEMANHEFIITYNLEEALDPLGLEIDKLTEEQREWCEIAKTQYLAACK